MARKLGKDGKVEVELGLTTYGMSALSSVSSPSADVNKKFLSSAERFTALDDYEPIVRLDGIISGCELSILSSSNNAVEISAGSYYLQGSKVTIVATTAESLARPTVNGQVLTTAISMDSNGLITKTPGTEGTTSITRGAAGGPPFIPVDEILLGYATLGYKATSVGAVVESTEIDNASKERSSIPGYKVIYHDEDNSVGIIEFDVALDSIHTGSVTRNVYSQYWGPAAYVSIGDAKDITLDEPPTVQTSQAYGDDYARSAIGTKTWTGGFDFYFSNVKDSIIDLIKNSKRWLKFYPDKDNTEHLTGRAIIGASHSIPVDDTMNGSVTLTGDGELISKA